VKPQKKYIKYIALLEKRKKIYLYSKAAKRNPAAHPKQSKLASCAFKRTIFLYFCTGDFILVALRRRLQPTKPAPTCACSLFSLSGSSLLPFSAHPYFSFPVPMPNAVAQLSTALLGNFQKHLKKQKCGNIAFIKILFST